MSQEEAHLDDRASHFRIDHLCELLLSRFRSRSKRFATLELSLLSAEKNIGAELYEWTGSAVSLRANGLMHELLKA